MDIHLRALALFVCVFLTACGGGGSSSPASPQSAPATYTVAMFGDSNVVREQVEVAKISGMLVDPHGVNGARVYQLPSGWLDGVTAKVVTLSYGVNDARLDSNESPEQFAATLAATVRQAQAAGKVVVVETPHPLIDPAASSGVYVATGTLQYAQAVRDVARLTGAVLCDQYAAIVADGDDNLTMIEDGVHSAPALTAKKATRTAACIRGGSK